MSGHDKFEFGKKYKFKHGNNIYTCVYKGEEGAVLRLDVGVEIWRRHTSRNKWEEVVERNLTIKVLIVLNKITDKIFWNAADLWGKEYHTKGFELPGYKVLDVIELNWEECQGQTNTSLLKVNGVQKP